MALFIHPWDMMGKSDMEQLLASVVGGHARDEQGGMFLDFQECWTNVLTCE